MENNPEAILSAAQGFIDEVSTRGAPIKDLLNTGTFPSGWSDRYLAFVERVSEHYGKTDPLPREVIAVIYCASVYCTKRYFDWRHSTGSANEATEALVNQIRWAGDSLLLSRFYYRDEPTVLDTP